MLRFSETKTREANTDIANAYSIVYKELVKNNFSEKYRKDARKEIVEINTAYFIQAF